MPAMPVMRLIRTPAPLISAANSTRITIGGHASRSNPVPASAAAANARMFFFMPSGSFLLLVLHLLLYFGFRLPDRLFPHLLDQFPSMLFAHGLELSLLRRIQERRDFGIDGAADLLQLLYLLQRLERGVLLQGAELLQLVLQEGQNLLFLLFVQSQLDRELVERCVQRIEHELRARNDLVVGVAEFAAARAVIGVAQLVDRNCDGILGDVGHHLAAFDFVGCGYTFITIAQRVANIAGNGRAMADMPHIAIAFCRV